MKSNFSFLTVCVLLASIINAQDTATCEGKPRGSVWAATCCKCKDNCVLIASKPRMPGDCRECNLLCVECREAMGDLNQELEKLKQKNRALYKAYQVIEDDLNESNKKFYDAATRITGMKDDPEGWNLDGLFGSGSFLNFSTSLLGFASNFTGTGKTTKLIDKKWFSTGGTIVSNGAGIYQTASGRSDYNSNAGIADEVANWTGASTDFLTSDFWKWLNETLKTMDEIGVTSMIEDFFNFKRFAVDQSPIYKLTPADIQGLGNIALLSDIWSLGRSFYILINDITDLLSAYYLAIDAEKELQKIQDDILYNNFLIACIKETQDFLNKGGSTLNRPGNTVFGKLGISLIAPSIISFNTNCVRCFSKNDFVKRNYMVDEPKIKSAISTLNQLINIEKQNETIFAKKIFPAFYPWITGKWKKQEPAVLIQILKKGKTGFQELIKNCEKMVSLHESVKNLLRYAVIFEKGINDGTGSTLNSPLSEYEDGSFYITGHKPDSAVMNSEIWSSFNNKKIPAGKGRLNLVLPANVDWTVDIYTAENKFYINRSSYSKHGSYDLPAGNYYFKFNSIPIDNVSIEKGHEIKFKLGILNIMTPGNWEIYDEEKKKYYTSGNKPKKMALPMGTYQLVFDSKIYRIRIKEGVVLKFNLKKSFGMEE